MILIALLSKTNAHNPEAKFYALYQRNDENQSYNFIPLYNIPQLPFSISFPTVVLLKLLQYRPADRRWAAIVVVMQITVAKAKIKLQQHFACYELDHYLSRTTNCT